MRTVFLDTVGLLAVWDSADQWHVAAEPVFQTLLTDRVRLDDYARRCLRRNRRLRGSHPLAEADARRRHAQERRRLGFYRKKQPYRQERLALNDGLTPTIAILLAKIDDQQSKGSPMPKTKSLYRKQVFAEVETVPEEYLPFLLQMIRSYRESVDLKPAAESFKTGWQEAQAGETTSVKHLWEGIHGE